MRSAATRPRASSTPTTSTPVCTRGSPSASPRAIARGSHCRSPAKNDAPSTAPVSRGSSSRRRAASSSSPGTPAALSFRGDDPAGRDDRLLLVNFGTDVNLSPVPEPLLAPPGPEGWRVCWSSEALAYGGTGTAKLATDEGWVLSGESALILSPAGGRAMTAATISALPM